MAETYQIVRMYRDREEKRKVIKTGLTLPQAQAHDRGRALRTLKWIEPFLRGRYEGPPSVKRLWTATRVYLALTVASLLGAASLFWLVRLVLSFFL